MSIFKRLRAGVKRAHQAVTQPKRYTLMGKFVTCSHCGGQTFFAREAQLNTSWRTFLNVDWLDENAAVLVCSKCGHLEWFLSNPKSFTSST